jgi:hypothetical protein
MAVNRATDKPLSSTIYRPIGSFQAWIEPVDAEAIHAKSKEFFDTLIRVPIYFPTTFRSASLILYCQPDPASCR